MKTKIYYAVRVGNPELGCLLWSGSGAVPVILDSKMEARIVANSLSVRTKVVKVKITIVK